MTKTAVAAVRHEASSSFRHSIRHVSSKYATRGDGE